MKKMLFFVSVITTLLLLTGCPNIVNYTPKIKLNDQVVKEGETIQIDLLKFTYDKNQQKVLGNTGNDYMTYELISGKGEISDSIYSYTPGYTEAGTYTIQIGVTDKWGSKAQDSFALTVVDVNATPTINLDSVPDALEGKGYSIDLSLYSTDPDGDPLTFELLTGEGTITGNIFTFNPDFDSAGTHAFTIRVTDSTGASSTCSFEIEVIDVNQPPHTDTVYMIINEGINYSMDFAAVFPSSFYDPEGDSFYFEKISGPGSFYDTTYSWNIGYEDAGFYIVKARAVDTHDASSTFEMEITIKNINRAPIIGTMTPANNTTDVSTDTLLTWTANDPDGDDLTYDVYFGTTSNPSLAATGLTTNSYDPGDLDEGTVYYWKVVAKDPEGATDESNVLKFTTSELQITTVPARNVLLEYFTGSWAGYGKMAQPSANDMANADNCVLISWFCGDIYEIPEGRIRNDYYQITGYPTAIFGGTNRFVGGGDVYESYVQKRDEVLPTLPSDINIGTRLRQNDQSIKVSYSIESLNQYTGDIYVVLVEDINIEEIVNGDPYGLAVNTARAVASETNKTISGTIMGSATFEIDPAWNLTNLSAVVFVETPEGSQGKIIAAIESRNLIE